MRSYFSLNSNQYANDRVIIHSLSTAFSASHRPSSVHGEGWYNSGGLILAKFWRALRAKFNSRARSLYGVGAKNLAGHGDPFVWGDRSRKAPANQHRSNGQASDEPSTN